MILSISEPQKGMEGPEFSDKLAILWNNEYKPVVVQYSSESWSIFPGSKISLYGPNCILMGVIIEELFCSRYFIPVLAFFNDNLTSVLLAGPAVLPLAKFNFDVLVLLKDLYCILLLSVMPVDAAQKKRWWNSVDWELRLGSFIPEGTSGGT